MLTFISFGSGSSGNCYYLATEKDGLLIDTGVGVRTLKKYLKEYGVSASSIHHILVTHDHADHIKAVGYFSTEHNIPVYATQQVHTGIVKNYSVTRKVAKELVCLIEKNQTITLGDFDITPFHVPHDSADNNGFLIEHQGVSFCLITDAGCVTDEMKKYISKANYLVIEANHDEEMVESGTYPTHLKRRILSNTGHLSNKSCGMTLAENMTEKLKKVWLCHLSEENNHPELARKTVSNVLASHGIIADKDITLEVLKRKNPMGPYQLV